ncbi:MAG TPA: helicase-related protein [Candidatus Paceibacterota bacterium]|nr:helicase-related protein [Candidatus Paceibacterota bacterium]
MAITNVGENTLSSSLKSILPNCDKIDALVGYFYFSGFRDLHHELKDKQIRILVGMDIDKKIIDKVSTLRDLNLDSYTTDTKTSSRSIAKEDYIENFSKIFNDTDFFDNDESQNAFEIFLDKIKDGSLQIKKTAQANHSKFYIFHNKKEFSTNGITPGMVIIGSSNLTFSGLKGQGERNLILHEPHYYKEHSDDFEKTWNDPENITITDLDSADTFVKEIKEKIWLYALPNPLLMYYKVLNEYFAVSEIENMKTPKHITGGKFSDLKYQKDAINLGIDRIKKFGGVIIADVVGLGKSIIASAIAHNLGYKTIIIAPPHLENQWKDYTAEFDFKGHIYSTGKIEEALQRHGDDESRLLIILDEAHKHRNEDTDNYKVLHRLCAGNYVMALSATPFNNDPKDIYALIKLFSTPGQSTIRTVENLSMSFHMLFKRYKAVRRDLRKNTKNDDGNPEIKDELHSIADELRKMIEPLIIRRSRLDLEEIEEYKEDLKAQGVAFAKVKDPQLLEYDLGDMFDLYVSTLEKIAPEDRSTSFIGARYKPASYISQGSKFLEKLIEQDDEDGMSAEEKLQRITQAQSNLARFMRRLLVRRFESSIGAFKLSLRNMITSSEAMLDWYENRQEVPIFKKGVLPDSEYLSELDEKELEDTLNKLEDKGLIRIPVSELQPQFGDHLRHDISLLKEIDSEWSNKNSDPKFEFFKQKIKQSLVENSKRKIVVFTEFSDTANYVYQKLQKDGFDRVFKYSSEDASDENKKIIRSNFDAGLEESKQSDDFDIIIATDAISEGFNLHRAGAIINYDIPYNPTRVIQRVGRINRINRKVFDELYIYNFFPTLTGELETRTKAISTLKMDLIHTLLGEDTKTLTSEEDLKNYFAKQYKEENNKNESLSWDAPYRNAWLKIKDDKKIMDQIARIPHRSRIARKTKDISGVVAFAKKSGNYVFAFGKTPETVEIVSPQVALPLFNQIIDSEESLQTTVNFDPIYKMAKEHIFKDNTKASVDGGRKQDALNRVKLLGDLYPQAKDLCIDIIRTIKDLDALPNGVLKEIVELRIDKANPEKAYLELKELIPSRYIESIFETADRANDDGKLIVLSEELIAL